MRQRICGLSASIFIGALAAAVCLGTAFGQDNTQTRQSAPDAADIYSKNCAQCHDNGVERAPNREAFNQMPAERVLAAMNTGPMMDVAAGLTPPQRRAIAVYLSGKPFAARAEATVSAAAMCQGAPGKFDPTTGAVWNGWGQNWSNTRFQTASAAGLAAAQVPNLKLKWAFGFPGELTRSAAPTMLGGRIFVGSGRGTIYSLDAATGCVEWTFDAGTGVRTAISIGKIDTASGPVNAAFFGNGRAEAFALDAATGKQLWKTKVEEFPGAGITGSPVFHDGKLYVPVRGNDEVSAVAPNYECCRFRGSLSQLDGATGKVIWKTYTIAEEPKPTKKNAAGAQLWGPSGAPIWTSPAIDTKLNAIYVATGDNYSEPDSRTSDAFMAFDMKTGRILWSRQMTTNDVWTSACRMPDKTNCPILDAPDFDFGASPILVTLPNGKRALVDGQKSGMVHAVDPDNQGELLWQTRVGTGGTLGGVQWGSAADANNVYVGVSDMGRIMLYDPNTKEDARKLFGAWEADPKVGGGIFALSLATGKVVWHTESPGCGTRKPCSPAQSAAVSAIPGVAFSGAVDGHMRAYSASNGAIIWDFDSQRTYQTVNGVEGHGGSINGSGPVIGGGMVVFNSGYAGGGTPGNVLLAFSVDGR